MGLLFFVSALKALESKAASADDAVLLQSSLFGTEWKALPFQLCMTNLLLHGLDSPNLINGDSLSKDVRSYGDSAELMQ